MSLVSAGTLPGHASEVRALKAERESCSVMNGIGVLAAPAEVMRGPLDQARLLLGLREMTRLPQCPCPTLTHQQIGHGKPIRGGLAL